MAPIALENFANTGFDKCEGFNDPADPLPGQILETSTLP